MQPQLGLKAAYFLLVEDSCESAQLFPDQAPMALRTYIVGIASPVKGRERKGALSPNPYVSHSRFRQKHVAIRGDVGQIRRYVE